MDCDKTAQNRQGDCVHEQVQYSPMEEGNGIRLRHLRYKIIYILCTVSPHYTIYSL